MNLFKKQWFAILLLVIAVAGGIALGLFRHDRDVEESAKQATSVSVSVGDTNAQTDVNVEVPKTDTDVKVETNIEPQKTVKDDDEDTDDGKFHLSKWKLILIIVVLYCVFQGRKKH